MSKAILVIDMPKDCPFCPVAHFNKLDEFTGCDIVGGKRYAMTTEEGYKDTNYRPAWCPLKPLPQKKNTEMSLNAMNDWLEHSERVGFNKCIDELLGDQK